MSEDTRMVAIDLGDGFPATLTIDQARALRGALSSLNLVDNTSLVTWEDERHTKIVDGVQIWAEVSTRPAVDLDTPLDLEVLDFPALAGCTNGAIHKDTRS